MAIYFQIWFIMIISTSNSENNSFERAEEWPDTSPKKHSTLKIPHFFITYQGNYSDTILQKPYHAVDWNTSNIFMYSVFLEVELFKQLRKYLQTSKPICKFHKPLASRVAYLVFSKS